MTLPESSGDHTLVSVRACADSTGFGFPTHEASTVPIVTILLAAAFGASLGSFLNVVLWRVPRGESLVSPPSHCPACDTDLGPAELVPIASWLALRGRCRHCGVHISARYPLVEAGCALAFGLIAWFVVG